VLGDLKRIELGEEVISGQGERDKQEEDVELVISIARDCCLPRSPQTTRTRVRGGQISVGPPGTANYQGYWGTRGTPNWVRVTSGRLSYIIMRSAGNSQ
jgi:hypothetical protein